MDPGFYGLLDFTGIPVGVPTAAPTGHAPKVGGRRQKAITRYLLEEQMRITQLEDLLAVNQRVLVRYVRQQVEYERFTTFVENFKRQQEFNAILAEV